MSDTSATLPWNFSWVVENEIAAMGWPKKLDSLIFLAQQGVRHLITLSKEMQPPIQQFSGLQWTLLPVEEFEAPSEEDIRKFIEICQECRRKKWPIGVHCRMGNGRTGTMIACYLVRFHGLTPERALTNLRLKRPGSVETYKQERAVFEYYDALRNTAEDGISNGCD